LLPICLKHSGSVALLRQRHGRRSVPRLGSPRAPRARLDYAELGRLWTLLAAHFQAGFPVPVCPSPDVSADAIAIIWRSCWRRSHPARAKRLVAARL